MTHRVVVPQARQVHPAVAIFTTPAKISITITANRASPHDQAPQKRNCSLPRWSRSLKRGRKIKLSPLKIFWRSHGISRSKAICISRRSNIDRQSGAIAELSSIQEPLSNLNYRSCKLPRQNRSSRRRKRRRNRPSKMERPVLILETRGSKT